MAVCSIWVLVGREEGGDGQKCSCPPCPPCPPNRGNSPLSTKGLWKTLNLVAGTQS